MFLFLTLSHNTRFASEKAAAQASSGAQQQPLAENTQMATMFSPRRLDIQRMWAIIDRARDPLIFALRESEPRGVY